MGYETHYLGVRRIKSNIYDMIFYKNSARRVLVNIYLFKFNNRNTKKGCEICSNLAIKTPERHCLRYLHYFFSRCV